MPFSLAAWKARPNHDSEKMVALLLSAILLMGLIAYQYATPNGTMLILRGIAADNAPKGQLDDEAAKQYAQRMGYAGKILDVAGATGEQINLTLDEVRNHRNVRALYGFSGGGFALVNVWNLMTPEERGRISKLVVIGAPGVTEASFPGAAEVVIQPDPPEGHMEGPRALLRATQ